MKKIKLKYKIIISIIVCLFTLNTSFYIYGNSIKDLKKKQNKIKEESYNLKKVILDIESKKSFTEKEVREVDNILENIISDIDIIVCNLNKKEKDLDTKKIELKEAEDIKKEQSNIFVKRLRVMYKNNKMTYFDIILKSSSFHDLIKRVDYINKIVQYDNKILSDLIKTEKIILKKVEEIEEEKKQLEVLKIQEISKKENYENIRIEKEKLINKFMKESDKYKDKLNDLEKSSKQIESLIKSKQKNINQNVNYNGKLCWPLPNRTRISSGFGMRVHPITGVLKGHTGIDIPGPLGSNIVAAEDGIVINSKYLGGYGNTVVINHGNGISTLYAHNSKNIVKVGSKVKKGDIIAKVGSTGFATGNHLHFEVRLNGIPKPPLTYLK